MNRRPVSAAIGSIALWALLLILLVLPPVNGTVFQAEKHSHITNLHYIDDDLFIWAQTYQQDGVIGGDLFCGSSDATVSGQVKGSANIFADNLTFRGTVDGSLRTMCNTVNVTGAVQKSLLSFGRKVTIDRSATIGRDVHLYGNIVSFEGLCSGDLNSAGEELVVSGTINGDVSLRSEHITFVPPLMIKGNLVIEAKNAPVIDTASGIDIVGSVTVKAPEKKEEEERSFGFSDVVLMISKLLAAFLLGLLLMKIFREHTERAFLQLRHHFAQSLAVGVLTVIVVVLCALTLVVSIALSILGLILISGDSASLGAIVLSLSILLIPITSFATVSGGVLFYVGKIIFALIIGCWIISKMSRRATVLSGPQLFLGLFVISLLMMIPVGGFWIYLFVSIIGTGSIVLGIKAKPAASLNPPIPPPPIPPVSPTEQ